MRSDIPLEILLFVGASLLANPAVTGLFPFGPAQALFAMEPRPAFAGMTGIDRCFRITLDSPFAEDSPLSLQGEGWGEGALEASAYATGKPRSRASSLLQS
ncbi:hypothetical protein Pssp01_07130 [Pseudomonas sp. NBRC 100443]|nr:hypothetical protein Pssp01_07130 [Pseudomonas sp. NBRC 100443]